MTDHPPDQPSRARAWLLLGVLVLGYIGIYLCRKNFSVANPLIKDAFNLTKEDIGKIASLSTIAYMVGKFAFGPIIDRVGGRLAFLLSLLFVALFGAAGGLVGSLPALTLVYSLNRLFGSAGWGGMVKMVPNWFPGRSLPLAMAILSLSFVFGGVCATVIAGYIADWSHNNWRWVMGGPALLLAAILILCWTILPCDRPRPQPQSPQSPSTPTTGFQLSHLYELLLIRRFWIVCSLSFTLTLLRETFNTWTVDFFKTTGGTDVSTRIAALLSTPFDALGAVGIVLLGWAFGVLTPQRRAWLLFALLSSLAVVVYALPIVGTRSLLGGTVAVGCVGFLAYGPYSLLAGVLAVEIRGKEYVGTVAGIVDGVGYLAAILAGQQFGRILDHGGYRLGFACLAVLSALSAVLCLFIYRRHDPPPLDAPAPHSPASP